MVVCSSMNTGSVVGTPKPYTMQKNLFELFALTRVPTRTGKPGKMGRHFPVREKSGNFGQTGKVRENHTKYWKTQGI